MGAISNQGRQGIGMGRRQYLIKQRKHIYEIPFPAIVFTVKFRIT